MPLNVGIIDPSIVTQGVRESKIDLATPVNMYTALRADSRAQKLSELTLSKEEKAQKRSAELQGIIQGNLTPDGHIHTEKMVPALNRAGFVDEASAIQERYLKAAEARRAAEEAQDKERSSAFLAVADAKNPVEAFILAKEEGNKRGWKMSPGVLNYIPGDEEIRDGKLDPRVMQEMRYHGERYLTPEQKIARAKATGEDGSGDEFGLTPIYGKDAAGKTIALQTSKKGGIKQIELPEGITLTPGVTHIDMGDETGILDKSGKVVARIAKGIDPGKAADLEIDRAKEARDSEEYAKKVRAYATKAQGETSSIQTFIDRAYKVKDNKNMKYVTGMGRLAKNLWGSEAANLQADIDFLVSSGVIETLTQLKNQSPTGATGFGALSDSELTAIKNAFSVLGNDKISPEKKKAEVERVLSIMEGRIREHREITRESDKSLGPEPTDAEKRKEKMRKL